MITSLTRKHFSRFKNKRNVFSFISIPRGFVYSIDMKAGKPIVKSRITALTSVNSVLMGIHAKERYTDLILDLLHGVIPDKDMQLLGVVTYGVGKKRTTKTGDAKQGLDFDGTYNPQFVTGELLCQEFRLQADIQLGIDKDPFLFLTSMGTTSELDVVKLLRKQDRIALSKHYAKNLYEVDCVFRLRSVLNSVVHSLYPYERHNHPVILNQRSLIKADAKSKYKPNLPFGFLIMKLHSDDYPIYKV